MRHGFRLGTASWRTAPALRHRSSSAARWVPLLLPPLLPGFALSSFIAGPAAVLLGTGGASMAAFWAWWLSPTAGAAVSVALLAGSAMVVVVRGADREVMRPAVMITGLTLLFSAVVFARGGEAMGAEAVIAVMWGVLDNTIPALVADAVAGGQHPRIIVGDWLLSDRPPLQSGALLLVRPLVGSSPFAHQIVGTMLQASWLMGLWAVIGHQRNAARVSLLVALTGFVFFNSVFVWPKLLAGAMILAALGEALRRRPVQAVALVALGLLAHGGALFAALGLAPFLRIHRRHVAAAVAVAVVSLGPWLAYQRWSNPPGDRLLRWHLAGDVARDGPSATTSIADAYRTRTAEEIVTLKARNAGYLVWGEGWSRRGRSSYLPIDNWKDDWAGRLRLLTTTTLLFAPAGLLFGLTRIRRSPLLAFAGIGVVVWVALMFGTPMSTTYLHHASYATPLALLAALAHPLSASRLFFGLHAASFVALWLAFEPAAGSAGPFRTAALAVAALGAVMASSPAWREWRQGRSR